VSRLDLLPRLGNIMSLCMQVYSVIFFSIEVAQEDGLF